MSGCDVKKILIDGVEYVRADSVKAPPIPGARHVLVLDRGWIVAGDVKEVDGRIKVTRALLVEGWNEIGLDGMLANPKSSKVRLKSIPNGFDCPLDAELFRIPVSDDWGV